MQTNSTTFLIEIEHLVKKFAQEPVIDALSLKIPKGIIFGLLGPNGAGKTTLIRMLCSILKSDSGTIRINSQEGEQAKSSFGYVAQSFGEYEELSVWENLLFYAQMYGVRDKNRLEYLLTRYDLQQYRGKPAGALSGGYKRRLALVCALSHDPLVLFLDEPTAGIDPVTRKLLWDDFYKLSQEGKTLFVTTHYMEEAERCHQLAFLSKGKIVAQGTPHSIKESLKNVQMYKISIPYNPALIEYLQSFQEILLINQFGEELHLLLNKEYPIATIVHAIQKKMQLSLDFTKSTLTLEDVFIALTQEKHS